MPPFSKQHSPNRFFNNGALNDLESLIRVLGLNNGTKKKIGIISDYIQIKSLLWWIYNPYKKFGITSDQLKKHRDILDDELIYMALADLLEMLSTRELSGHKAIGTINAFIKEYGYADVIYRIIDKDLQCRIDAKSINKAFPDLIPTFNVALAEDYNKAKNVTITEYCWSRKLDGVRCITRIEDGKVTFYSRAGHEFETLNVLREEIEKMELKNCILDGEICLTDANGKENFQDVMKEIRRKNHTILNPRYLVFDRLSLTDFDNGVSKDDLRQRLNNAKIYIDFKKSVYLSLVPQTYIETEKDLKDAIDLANREGWEGLILRKDAPYKGKRSSDLLKVKKMHDSEYEVKDVIMGEIDDGHSNKVEGLSAVVIEHKGNKVKVGSGFTFEERMWYHSYPEKLLERIITVQYFEETTNQKGEHSLRFPIVKAIHGEERAV